MVSNSLFLLIPTKSHQEGYEQIALSLGFNFSPSVNCGMNSFGKGIRNSNVTLIKNCCRWQRPAVMNRPVGRNSNICFWPRVAAWKKILSVTAKAFLPSRQFFFPFYAFYFLKHFVFSNSSGNFFLT